MVGHVHCRIAIALRAMSDDEAVVLCNGILGNNAEVAGEALLHMWAPQGKADGGVLCFNNLPMPHAIGEAGFAAVERVRTKIIGERILRIANLNAGVLNSVGYSPDRGANVRTNLLILLHGVQSNNQLLGIAACTMEHRG